MDRVARQLAARLHSVFDPDPDAALALRVRHPERASWRVEGDTLTLSVSGSSIEYHLAQWTLSELAAMITNDGFEVISLHPELAHFSARILIDGHGSEDISSGDHITAITSPIAILLSALGQELRLGAETIVAALRQLLLPHSTGEWADLFGGIFGIPRLPSEPDEHYTARIIDETLRHRSNPAAILRNIKRLTGRDLEIREPWKEVAYLDQSALSGSDHLQGAPIYEYHTMQVVARQGLDWVPVLREVNSDRPAGTIMLPPATHPWPWLNDEIKPVPKLCRVDVRADWLRLHAHGALSRDLLLSHMRPPPMLRISPVIVYGMGCVGLRGPYGGIEDMFKWVGEWDDRIWTQPSTYPVEMSPPRDILDA